jgi:hypothetical protein
MNVGTLGRGAEQQAMPNLNHASLVDCDCIYVIGAIVMTRPKVDVRRREKRS